MVHELKTWPGPFRQVKSGEKKHEIRNYDRPFDVGHELRLHEFDPVAEAYTGDELTVRVTHMTWPGMWGLPAGVCVMSIERVAS